MNVLISLHRGYGLGDGVQMSAVLRHVAAARPHWDISYQAEEGKHQVGRCIVERTFAYGKQPQDIHYDAEVMICLYDTWANWHDRPNTRVSSALHDQFNLPWRSEYGRYKVHVSQQSQNAANTLLYGYMPIMGVMYRHKHGHLNKDIRYVAVHYEGDSSQTKKNLTHSQADDICQEIKRLGREPVVLDWRVRSPLKCRKITTPSDWGADAEMVCAVISECEAFVGIDSGPSKCASATNTPALVTWTGHHPAPFHDPAPNTTHLVPEGYHGLEPVCNDAGVIKWFEAHHQVREYKHDPVKEIRQWLTETLK